MSTKEKKASRPEKSTFYFLSFDNNSSNLQLTKEGSMKKFIIHKKNINIILKVIIFI